MYTSETFCMKRSFLHTKSIWLKQLCNRNRGLRCYYSFPGEKTFREMNPRCPNWTANVLISMHGFTLNLALLGEPCVGRESHLGCFMPSGPNQWKPYQVKHVFDWRLRSIFWALFLGINPSYGMYKNEDFENKLKDMITESVTEHKTAETDNFLHVKVVEHTL